MDQLQASIAAFSVDNHDASNPNSAWSNIRLKADSLACDFYTALTLDCGIDQESRNAVATLLQQAVQIIPHDVDPCVVEKMQSDIADILLADADEEDI